MPEVRRYFIGLGGGLGLDSDAPVLSGFSCHKDRANPAQQRGGV